MQRTEIEISGMTCGHCAMSISKELSAVEGVHVLKVDPATGKAIIEGDASEEDLSEAVDKAGYQATKFVKVND
jgi:copper chaperone